MTAAPGWSEDSVVTSSISVACAAAPFASAAQVADVRMRPGRLGLVAGTEEFSPISGAISPRSGESSSAPDKDPPTAVALPGAWVRTNRCNALDDSAALPRTATPRRSRTSSAARARAGAGMSSHRSSAENAASLRPAGSPCRATARPSDGTAFLNVVPMVDQSQGRRERIADRPRIQHRDRKRGTDSLTSSPRRASASGSPGRARAGTPSPSAGR
jgi:hypothetical protein